VATSLDYVLLGYWTVASLAIGALVALLYRVLAGNGKVLPRTISIPMTSSVSIVSAEANSKLESAVGMINSGDYGGAAFAAYEATNLLLNECCVKMGVDATSATLDELCSRLVSARLADLECAKVKFLEIVVKGGNGTVNEAVSRRCVEVAVGLRDYLVNARLVAGSWPPEKV
jgi:HEPN domain-containing protein